jgi:hypothetical protein
MASERLTAAYAKGADEVNKVTVALRAEDEARRQKLGTSETDLYQLTLENEQRAKAAEELGKVTAGLRDQNEMMEAQLKLGPLAGQFAIGSAQIDTQLAQYRRKNPGVDTTAYENTLRQGLIDKQDLQRNADLKQGFQEMGQAAFTAFDRARQGGANMRNIMNGLLLDIERIGEKLLIEKPLMTWFENSMSGMNGDSGLAGMLGGVGKFLGFGEVRPQRRPTIATP